MKIIGYAFARLKGRQFLTTMRADIEAREIAAVVSLQHQTVMIAAEALTTGPGFPQRSCVITQHTMCKYSTWMTKSIRENSEIFIR
jgi:hypothetical protein